MPASIQVDIRTRFLPDDHRIYILFPGDGYRYYHVMREESVVFLDIPAFPMPNGRVSEARDLVKRIVISERVREWHNKDRPIDKEPTRDPREVKSYRTTTARTQFAAVIARFFSTLKKGDVIVVPPQNLEDDILFGELVDDPDKIVYVRSQNYKGERIPGRRIKWIARKKRLDAPTWLERKIPSPNPLRQFEKSTYLFVYDIMYERYHFNGQFVCKLSVSSTDFSSFDNFLIQQLILYPSALFEANQDDNDAVKKSDPIAITVSRLRFSPEIPDQRIAIASPGHIVVYAQNIVPLLVGVLLSAAAAAGETAPPSQIKIVNSVDSNVMSRRCQSDIEVEATLDLNNMGYARWRELCVIELETRKRTSLDPGMTSTITSAPVPAAKPGTGGRTGRRN